MSLSDTHTNAIAKTFEFNPSKSSNTSLVKTIALCLLAVLALLHGLLFLLLIPPWQHYDEPSHFLYAAEIAAGELWEPGSASDALRREIASSMYRHNFYPLGVQPDLAAPEAPVLGYDQRYHPPLYYILASFPQRLVANRPVEQRLYAVRTLSVFFYVLTILTAWRIGTILAPDDPSIQINFPLLVLLSPTFVDIMTAVNNDVLLNFSLTVVLLGSVLLIRDGLRFAPFILALLGMSVALLTKRTAAVGIFLLIMTLFWSVWRNRLRWRAAAMIGLAGITLVSMATLQLTEVEGPSGQHLILSARPWFRALDETYLRLSIDETIQSISDPDRIGDRYKTLTVLTFSGLYTQFAWGHITMHPAWTWILAGIASAAAIGLTAGFVRSWPRLSLWQTRCIALFLIAVIMAWISIYIRIHPLPPLDAAVYFPRARYMYWSIVPHYWLLMLGIVRIFPSNWRRGVMTTLVTFFLSLNVSAWAGTILPFYQGAR